MPSSSVVQQSACQPPARAGQRVALADGRGTAIADYSAVLFSAGILLHALFVMMLFALAVGTSALTLTGCNTVSGAGKDLSAAGNKVTEEAQEHKKY